VNVPAGGTAQVVVIVQRQGYDGEIRLSIPNLPQGFSVAVAMCHRKLRGNHLTMTMPDGERHAVSSPLRLRKT